MACALQAWGAGERDGQGGGGRGLSRGAEGNTRERICTLHIDAIAALAGCSRTSVKNALRQARLLGLVLVKERRIPGLPSFTNILSIISKEWIG